MPPAHRLARCCLAGLCLTGLALAASAAGPVAARSAGAVLELRGVGFQVYDCRPLSDGAASGGYGWRLKAPDASLRDISGTEIGRHFAGPSWRARDGSMVVGEPLVSSPAPTSGAIPWLLLRARSHAGQGLFASVGYIARIRTQGGLAPASGCDQAHAGHEDRVPYQAVYLLFPQS